MTVTMPVSTDTVTGGSATWLLTPRPVERFEAVVGQRPAGAGDADAVGRRRASRARRTSCRRAGRAGGGRARARRAAGRVPTTPPAGRRRPAPGRRARRARRRRDRADRPGRRAAGCGRDRRCRGVGDGQLGVRRLPCRSGGGRPSVCSEAQANPMAETESRSPTSTDGSRPAARAWSSPPSAATSTASAGTAPTARASSGAAPVMTTTVTAIGQFLRRHYPVQVLGSAAAATLSAHWSRELPVLFGRPPYRGRPPIDAG